MSSMPSDICVIAMSIFYCAKEKYETWSVTRMFWCTPAKHNQYWYTSNDGLYLCWRRKITACILCAFIVWPCFWGLLYLTVTSQRWFEICFILQTCRLLPLSSPWSLPQKDTVDLNLWGTIWLLWLTDIKIALKHVNINTVSGPKSAPLIRILENKFVRIIDME